MIASSPMDFGPRSGERNIKSKTLFGVGQAGKCTLGVVPVLIIADRLGDRAPDRERRVLPAHRDIGAGGIVSSRGFPIEPLAPRLYEPSVADQDGDIAATSLES